MEIETISDNRVCFSGIIRYEEKRSIDFDGDKVWLEMIFLNWELLE
jgi:hypothetical protein